MEADWWDPPLKVQDLAEATDMILTMGDSLFCSYGGSLAVMSLS